MGHDEAGPGPARGLYRALDRPGEQMAVSQVLAVSSSFMLSPKMVFSITTISLVSFRLVSYFYLLLV